jgi:hypothetical protein
MIQLRLLLRAMPVMEEPLREGSIVVIEEKRIRVQRLPEVIVSHGCFN